MALHMKRPTVICLTPVKNEAWILERFLKCASLWADHIIVADQNSDDGSVEIAQSFEKVILVRNTSSDYSETERQKLLIDAARKIPSPRLLIALDVDEFLTPNFLISPEWQTVLLASKGTVVYFQWANIRPDIRHYWAPQVEFPFGFHDDGSPHEGRAMHSARIPIPSHAPIIKLRDIKVMHYQYTDWDRMKSKHRWYLAWERINTPNISALSLYRQYHHMYAVQGAEIQNIPDWWFEGYGRQGIDMTSIFKDRPYRWDKDLIELLREHGTKLFARDQIWDIDWQQIARQYGCSAEEAAHFKDPRNLLQKMIHRWLQRTQPHSKSLIVRNVDSVLAKFF